MSNIKKGNMMSKEENFSLTKGCSFIFMEEGHEIKAWFSNITGMEKVYVNGKLVCSTRNISKNSTHHFQLDENTYSVNLVVESILCGPVICTLSKNNSPHQTKHLVMSTGISNRNLVAIILTGIGLGFAASYFDVPSIIFYGCLAVFFLVSAYMGSKTLKIKDVDD